MITQRRIRFFMTSVIVLLLAGGWIFDYVQAKNDNLYESIILFNNIIKNVKEHYVEEMDSRELVMSAIDGLRKRLDPHTAYFDEEANKSLQVHTKGEFGGLGIQIGIRDKDLTVISPIEGTPAYKVGLQAGDKIIEIDGVPTKGISLDDAVNKLRGKKGTAVNIAIQRVGVTEILNYSIVRDIIKIKSVPFAGIIDGKIGYLKLTAFSQNTEEELAKKLQELNGKGMESLILDLRGNPGGLLAQAVTVSGQFLKSGQLVVYTRGRNETQNHEYNSSEEPLLDLNKRLVVLINEGSASASEIVAGAIQDWDRGVILGKTTFGKGSVQTIIPITRDKDALKLTTAYYYTPSGRCINKLGNGDEEEDEEAVEDKDKNAQKSDTNQVFYTKGKRKVYGGGGITPDLEVEGLKIKKLDLVLLQQSMYFKFGIKYVAECRKNKIRIPIDFDVDENLLNEFKEFLRTEKFKYNTNTEQKINELKALYFMDETAVTKNDSLMAQATADQKKEITEMRQNFEKSGLKQMIDQLETVAEREKENDFYDGQEVIKLRLRMEILGDSYGEEANYQVAIKTDKQILAALDLLKNKERYNTVLSVK